MSAFAELPCTGRSGRKFTLDKRLPSDRHKDYRNSWPPSNLILLPVLPVCIAPAHHSILVFFSKHTHRCWFADKLISRSATDMIPGRAWWYHVLSITWGWTGTCTTSPCLTDLAERLKVPTVELLALSNLCSLSCSHNTITQAVVYAQQIFTCCVRNYDHHWLQPSILSRTNGGIRLMATYSSTMPNLLLTIGGWSSSLRGIVECATGIYC